MVNIKLKKLHLDVCSPKKAHTEDACYDIYAYIKSNEVPSEFIIEPGQSAIIDTGFCTEIPVGYYCAIYARSGLGIKQNLRPSNAVGVVDSNFRGEWKVALYNDSNEVRIVKHGDRIAQFSILPVPESQLTLVDDLDETDRGIGGFGSSGV